MSDLNVIRKEFLLKLKETGQNSVSRTELNKLGQEAGLKSFGWFTKNDENKLSRGQYKVPEDISIALQPGGARLKVSSAKVIPFVPTKIVLADSGTRIANVTTELSITNLVPDVYDNYVPFGNFPDIVAIINSSRYSFQAILVMVKLCLLNKLVLN